MPAGVLALERLGVRARLDPERLSPFVGIRYLQEDGATAEARFAHGTGLGVRRTALVSALEQTARESGAEIWSSTVVDVQSVRVETDVVKLHAGSQEIEASVLVAADGLASPLRKHLGIDSPLPELGRRRFGLRRHYLRAAPSEFVEVHWSDGIEAYLTPVGPGRVGVAMLFETHDGSAHERPNFEAMLERFPKVRERIEGATLDSELRGAGPLSRRVPHVIRGRAVLLGDSAGYVDAITGEGLTLAFASAQVLGELLPEATKRPEVLCRYASAHRALFRRYALTAGSLLWLSRHPELRRRVVRLLSHFPGLFSGALRLVA